MSLALVFLACFAGGICPLVNADAVLLGAALLGRDGGALALIVSAVAGQVAGKLVLFGLVRSGARRALAALSLGRRAPRRPPQALARCTDLVRRLPLTGGTAITVSAAAGVPPFFAMTFAAAAGGITASRFCAAATAGRTVRTAVIVLAPRIVMGG